MLTQPLTIMYPERFTSTAFLAASRHMMMTGYEGADRFSLPVRLISCGMGGGSPTDRLYEAMTSVELREHPYRPDPWHGVSHKLASGIHDAAPPVREPKLQAECM